jgi:ABC-type transporter lipoprotein component MlaA
MTNGGAGSVTATQVVREHSARGPRPGDTYPHALLTTAVLTARLDDARERLYRAKEEHDEAMSDYLTTRDAWIRRQRDGLVRRVMR